MPSLLNGEGPVKLCGRKVYVKWLISGWKKFSDIFMTPLNTDGIFQVTTGNECPLCDFSTMAGLFSYLFHSEHLSDISWSKPSLHNPIVHVISSNPSYRAAISF